MLYILNLYSAVNYMWIKLEKMKNKWEKKALFKILQLRGGRDKTLLKSFVFFCHVKMSFLKEEIFLWAIMVELYGME